MLSLGTNLAEFVAPGAYRQRCSCISVACFSDSRLQLQLHSACSTTAGSGRFCRVLVVKNRADDHIILLWLF